MTFYIVFHERNCPISYSALLYCTLARFVNIASYNQCANSCQGGAGISCDNRLHRNLFYGPKNHSHEQCLQNSFWCGVLTRISSLRSAYSRSVAYRCVRLCRFAYLGAPLERGLPRQGVRTLSRLLLIPLLNASLELRGHERPMR